MSQPRPADTGNRAFWSLVAARPVVGPPEPAAGSASAGRHRCRDRPRGLVARQVRPPDRRLRPPDPRPPHHRVTTGGRRGWPRGNRPRPSGRARRQLSVRRPHLRHRPPPGAHSSGLAATLSDAELAAVLSHEREHLRSHDPLKNVLARAIPARHFYLPALARLRERFTAGRELAADRVAWPATAGRPWPAPCSRSPKARPGPSPARVPR